MNPRFTVCSVQTLYLESEAFIIKPQLTLLALSATPPHFRQNEPLIVGLYFPPPKVFHPASIVLGIVHCAGIFFAAPLRRILFAFSDPSLMSRGTKAALLF